MSNLSWIERLKLGTAKSYVSFNSDMLTGQFDREVKISEDRRQVNEYTLTYKARATGQEAAASILKGVLYKEVRTDLNDLYDLILSGCDEVLAMERIGKLIKRYGR